MNPEHDSRPYIGVAAMVWKGDYLLLGKRISTNSENSWQFPGGHLEVGETVTNCSKREVEEETGLVVEEINHLGYTNDAFTVSGRHYVTLYVAARYAGGDAVVMEPDKCECWDWFKWDQLPTPLFLPIQHYLEQHPDLGIFRFDMDTQVAAHR